MRQIILHGAISPQPLRAAQHNFRVNRMAYAVYAAVRRSGEPQNERDVV